MALILPLEARENACVWGWLESLIATNGPIRKLVPVDVRQSMANGGGPACLRLRVVADPATIDPRFMVDAARLDLIAGVIEAYWPEAIHPDDLADPELWRAIANARIQLLTTLGLEELI